MTNKSNDGWLNLELTEPQLFELEKIKRAVPKMSRPKLEELVLEAVRMSYGYQNAFKSVVKEEGNL